MVGPLTTTPCKRLDRDREHRPRHRLGGRVPQAHGDRLAAADPGDLLAEAVEQLDPLDAGLARTPTVARLGGAVLAEEERPGVGLDHLTGVTVGHLVALFEPDGVVAHVDHRLHRVRDDDDRLAVVLQLGEALQAFALEGLVADGEDLVHEQYVGLDVDRHREPEAHVHARGVVLHRLVDELADAGEVDDVVEAGQRALSA